MPVKESIVGYHRLKTLMTEIRWKDSTKLQSPKKKKKKKKNPIFWAESEK